MDGAQDIIPTKGGARALPATDDAFCVCPMPFARLDVSTETGTA